MASIAPIVIECIDYLAYGTILMCAMFCPKIKLDVFPRQKVSAGEVVWSYFLLFSS